MNPRQCPLWSTHAPTNSTNQWTTPPVFVTFYIDFLFKKKKKWYFSWSRGTWFGKKTRGRYPPRLATISDTYDQDVVALKFFSDGSEPIRKRNISERTLPGSSNVG